MALFGIILIQDNQQVRSLIELYYPKNIKPTEDFYVVSSPQTDPEQVARQINMATSDGKGSPGIVFRLEGSYYGFASNDIWKWLNTEVQAFLRRYG